MTGVQTVLPNPTRPSIRSDTPTPDTPALAQPAPRLPPAPPQAALAFLPLQRPLQPARARCVSTSTLHFLAQLRAGLAQLRAGLAQLRAGLARQLKEMLRKAEQNAGEAGG